ncbi:unnamed protein product [Didymodactylos carnosus]|uniref:Uncharacterized protein n=1 Tax=Didymodactylos carnosus TaxID=1234261 RepID=A0A815UZF9_9BILA|nr:unnamed protein product [Didymodactylos carnosus]CAF4380287.1 unnamed protein product [Didymodactylos carnosus]
MSSDETAISIITSEHLQDYIIVDQINKTTTVIHHKSLSPVLDPIIWLLTKPTINIHIKLNKLKNVTVRNVGVFAGAINCTTTRDDDCEQFYFSAYSVNNITLKLFDFKRFDAYLYHTGATKFYGRIDGQATIKYNTTIGFTDMYGFYSRKTELIEEDSNDNYYEKLNMADDRNKWW